MKDVALSGGEIIRDEDILGEWVECYSLVEFLRQQLKHFVVVTLK